MSNAFNLFDLPLRFNVDMAQLDSTYLKAQKAVHPDLFIGRDEVERQIAAQQAATLNEAYRRLKNPLARAEEFLKAKGIAVPGAQGSTISDSSLLEETLEWRHRIQEKDRLDELHQDLKERLKRCTVRFDQVQTEHLPECYLEFIYTYKTITELELSWEK